MPTLAERWAAELAAWAIDPELIAAAPESPYFFPPELFAPPPEPIDSPSRRRALEALPSGGSVLDVGCGGGTASLALVPPAGSLVGVDESVAMLAMYGDVARDRGVPVTIVAGRWPDVAANVPVCDVVVCHHVLYNVPDLPAFARALDRSARRRVVIEVTRVHALTRLNSLWWHFHHQDRPSGPSAELAAAVLREAGLTVREEHAVQPPRPVPLPARAAFARRRLCLPPEREPEVAALLPATEEPRDTVTLWWDVAEPSE